MIESTVFPRSLAQQQLQALGDLYFYRGSVLLLSFVSVVSPVLSFLVPFFV